MRYKVMVRHVPTGSVFPVQVNSGIAIAESVAHAWMDRVGSEYDSVHITPDTGNEWKPGAVWESHTGVRWQVVETIGDMVHVSRIGDSEECYWALRSLVCCCKYVG